jgi:hypothetical protein
MACGLPSIHWLTMGNGESEFAAPLPHSTRRPPDLRAAGYWSPATWQPLT